MTSPRLGRRKALALTLAGLFPLRGAEAKDGGTEQDADGSKGNAALRGPERRTMLLEVHKLIETAADQAVRRLAGREPVGVMSYPSGGRLMAAEAEALGRWGPPPEALRAVRRIVADAIASPLYDLLCMLDGAREPEGWDVPWHPFEIRAAEKGAPPGTLHKAFQETSQEWQRRRPDPGWSLEGDPPKR